VIGPWLQNWEALFMHAKVDEAGLKAHIDAMVRNCSQPMFAESWDLSGDLQQIKLNLTQSDGHS
jgi:hypothetical protein